MSATEFYQEQHHQAQQQFNRIERTLKNITLLRIFVFLFIMASLYLISYQVMLGSAVLVCSILLFLILLRYQSQQSAKRTLVLEMLRISELELSLINGVTHDVIEPFEVASEHLYASDLDIVGKGSVFETLNRCETHQGAEKLLHHLSKPSVDKDTIEQYQFIIRELSTKPEFNLHFRALTKSAAITSNSTTRLKQFLNQPDYLYAKPWMKITLVLIPFYAVSAIIFAFTIQMYLPLISCVLFNWMLTAIYLKRNQQVHAAVGKHHQMLATFLALNQTVMHQKFTQPQLIKLQSLFTSSNQSIKLLAQLASTFDQRLNTMLGPVLNSLVLFDLQCVWRIERWKRAHAHVLVEWMEATGEFDKWLSLGHFAFTHPHYIFPSINASSNVFQVQSLKHPLMPDAAVGNDFSFNGLGEVFIITGSNMSGKSTFLRAVGSTMVFACCGLPVHAQAASLSPMSVMSSMRIHDSLQTQTSYFYAELKRLKRIMDELELGNKPCLILIDEMLKGTNSKEKLEGSKLIVEKLITCNAVSFIATHDLALGELAVKFPQSVYNYSFESNIRNQQLMFDYQIQKGIAQSTNATFLLKKMGIVQG